MKLYESKLNLGRNTPLYEYHKVAWQGYGHHLNNNAPFLLYMDRESSVLRVRSEKEPEWPVYFAVETMEIEVPEGDVSFTVLLDPVRRGEREVAIEEPEHVLAWAVAKLERAGLNIQDLRFRPVVDLPPLRRGGNVIPMNPWEFQVAAKVTDLEAWKAACSKGVGRKKRFGFGMIRF